MKIRIDTTVNLKFIPKRKFVFWFIQISENEFDNLNACKNWLRNYYCPNIFKSRSSIYFKQSEIYKFYPERRDEIDIHFN